MAEVVSGYVYLIGSIHHKWYKIGKSTRPVVRLKELRILLPFTIDFVKIWRVHDHTLVEQQLHQEFDEYHLNGEWFKFKKIEPVIQQIFKLAIGLVFESGIAREEDMVRLKSEQKKAMMVAYMEANGLNYRGKGCGVNWRIARDAINSLTASKPS